MVVIIALLPLFSLNTYAYSGYAYSMGGEFFLPVNGYNYDDIIQACDYWALCGYHSYYTAHPTKTYVTQSKLNSDVIYFSCHGAQHLISMPNSSLTINESTTNTSTVLGMGNISFTNNKLVVYDACSTAKTTNSDTGNFCKYTLNRGAGCVLGWYVDISTASINWQQKFQDHLALGYSINSSINYADSFTYTDTTLKSHRVYGSKYTIIKTGSKSASIDDRFIELPELTINFDKLNENLIIDYLVQNKVSESFDEYDIIITSTSEDNSSYVVDLIKTVDGIKTPYGYVMIFEESKCKGVYDNTSKLNSSCKPIKVSSESIEKYKTESETQVLSKEYDLDIIDTNYEIIFDPSTGCTYVDVYVIYALTNSGAKGNEKFSYKV